jgi:hypothetical protein
MLDFGNAAVKKEQNNENVVCRVHCGTHALYDCIFTSCRFQNKYFFERFVEIRPKK